LGTPATAPWKTGGGRNGLAADRGEAESARLTPAAQKEKIMIASVQLSTVTGEHLLAVQANDLDPYITLTVRQHSLHLTRDQARQAADALRACALTAIDDEFGNMQDIL
jgi:hypothetical protein